jgi:hypothetical protein
LGRGDGIGARRDLGAALGCVARAGVDVRARRTGVRARVDFVVVRVVFFFAGLAAARFVVRVLGRFAVDRLPLVRLAVVRLAVVRLAVGRLAVVRLAVVRLDVLLVARRVVVFFLAVDRLVDFVPVARFFERTGPLLFFRDAAAFNATPCVGFLAPAHEQDAQELPGSALQLSILAERVTANPTLFIGPIHRRGSVFFTPHKPFVKRDLRPSEGR